MNEETKAQARYLLELSIANLATGLQMLVKNRPDLAAHFMAQAAEWAAKAKRIKDTNNAKHVSNISD